MAAIQWNQGAEGGTGVTTADSLVICIKFILQQALEVLAGPK